MASRSKRCVPCRATVSFRHTLGISSVVDSLTVGVQFCLLLILAEGLRVSCDERLHFL
jgi:hypothetical protein